MDETRAIQQPCGGPSLASLRRFDTGELDVAERARTQAHVDACERCRAELHDFAAERSALRTALPFSALEAKLERQPVSQPFWKRFAIALLVPVAGVAAFVIFASSDEPQIRIKGEKLQFVVKTGDGARAGRDGEALRAGDEIRLKYAAEGRPFVLIVGVDADGEVFPYVTEGEKSAASQPGIPLAANAITLDADPRPERIFALFSNEPLAIDEIRPAARDAVRSAGGRIEAVRELPLGVRGVDQATVLLNKSR